MENAKKPFVSAIIVSAGNSTRMGGINKQFIKLCGIPVVAHSINAFQRNSNIDEIIVVTREDDINTMSSYISKYGFTKVTKIVAGGETRQKSVCNGIINCSRNSSFVAIHDGARPLISDDVITKAIISAFVTEASAVGVVSKDTVKIVDGNNKIVSTPERATLRCMQTPQVFSKELYLSAVNSVENSSNFTDDCMLIESYGHSVQVVEGDYKNLKITTPEDVILAEIIMKSQEKNND